MSKKIQNSKAQSFPLMFEHLEEYDLYDEANEDVLIRLGKALGSPIRLHILRQLHTKPLTITQISKLNALANSTTIFHLSILEKAGLISISYATGRHGEVQLVKTENKTFLLSDLPPDVEQAQTFPVEQSCPVALYAEGTPDTCFSITIGTESFHLYPHNLYDPIRVQANRLFTSGGRLTYVFSNGFAHDYIPKELRFSLEISSEITCYRNDWKSDVTFAVNGLDVATHTCPGDYGGTHGRFTPADWPDRASQYGDLVTVAINAEGTFLNNRRASSVTLADLDLARGDKLLFTLYTKKDAANYGGFNLFGRGWGNYDQDILCTALCTEKP